MKYLIVVDMQVDFVNGALGSDLAVAIVPNVVEKVKSFDGKVTYLVLLGATRESNIYKRHPLQGLYEHSRGKKSSRSSLYQGYRWLADLR